MVDQFNHYIVLDSIHVNGKATLGENIADLGGLVIGYDAFKRTQEGRADTLIMAPSPDQRYFLGYALSWLNHQRDESLAMQVMTDVHSPVSCASMDPCPTCPNSTGRSTSRRDRNYVPR